MREAASIVKATVLTTSTSAPEEELAVEVGHINGVHINDVQVPKAAQGQVLQQLTAQAASAHAQHAYLQRHKSATPSQCAHSQAASQAVTLTQSVISCLEHRPRFLLRSGPNTQASVATSREPKPLCDAARAAT